MVRKYGARRHTERAKNQLPSDDVEAFRHARSTGPASRSAGGTAGLTVTAVYVPVAVVDGVEVEGPELSESAVMTTLLLRGGRRWPRL